MEINGKQYEINMDTTLKTEKLIAKMLKDEDNPNNILYMQEVLRDILLPSPTTKEMEAFKRSDRERAFTAFGEAMEREEREVKKKRSR